jgi:NADH dehydrogenase [ubiquinone] 1 alpha subcomplex assembly factor 7
VTPLTARLLAEIAATGPIGVDRYMAACLGDPEFGYYTTRDPLGRGGDFVTAPEISQIFGELIGLWVAAVWQSLDSPSAFRLIELGPGRGTLMADALRALTVLPACRTAVHIDLVEISPILQERQRLTLAPHRDAIRIAWHGSIDTIPVDLPTIVIANEFFDALPIRQWIRRGGLWRERRIGREGEQLVFVDGDAASGIPLPLATDAAIAETSEQAAAVAAALGGRISATGGAALVVDYGHDGKRLGDSLQAIRGQAPAPVLEACGECDLTAHLDFAALAAAFAAAGLETAGPVTQGRWLTAIGAGTRAERLARDRDAATVAAISQGLRRLIDPMAMGSLFKVLGAASPGLGPLPGFTA